MNSGDTAWLLISTVLVFSMTLPGLAFFYGGLVRRKNVLSILMQCFSIAALIALQWVLFGYSLSFGPDVGYGVIGGLEWVGLRGVGANPFSEYAGTVPHALFMVFQCMFAIITPALMIGACAERVKFSSLMVFILLWATFVYDPLAHWVWGNGGWMKVLGGLDFAGGIVVHASSGVSALVICLLLGKRSGYLKEPFRPHNLPHTILGGCLLWIGWFGFNAGSALAANELATHALITTLIAPSAAGLTWACIEWYVNEKPTILGAVSGALAGLVAITPACGYVNVMNAVFIGVIAGAVCYLFVVKVKNILGYDDSLDAFGIHGIGGIWGTIATGLFAEKAVNSAGADGLFFGGSQLVPQLIMVLVAPIFAAVVTYILYKAVDLTLGLRVNDKDETIGLDLTQHGEAAYTVIE
ncbi:MAG: ammonium transporter [Syntrophales bacterium]|nr:ammonium transporter [Syntrophales bacterium]